MSIIIPDLSGISEGVRHASGALAQALERRAEQRLTQKATESKQKGMDVLTEWAGSYNPQLSPMENIGALKQALQDSGADPSVTQPILQDVLKKAVAQQGEQYGAAQIFGQTGGQPPPASEPTPLPLEGQKPPPAPPAPEDPMQKFSNEELVGMSANPNRIVSQSAKSELVKRKLDQQVIEGDRRYHSQFTLPQEKKIEGLRESLPKKEMALRHARAAVESGEVGAFSINQIADTIGGAIGDTMRTATGAQLATAGKENLLGNMSRVSAKGLNQWFEQRLAAMFPKVGQSEAANLAVQEMLEGELNMEKAYLRKFDEFSQADEGLYGFAKKDVDRRARGAVVTLEDVTFKRSVYRLKQLEESEKGRKGMQKSLMKKVQKGTPLTLERGAMLLEKFGDARSAMENAKKLGYSIPDAEDLKVYLMSSDEFSEKLMGM